MFKYRVTLIFSAGNHVVFECERIEYMGNIAYDEKCIRNIKFINCNDPNYRIDVDWDHVVFCSVIPIDKDEQA